MAEFTPDMKERITDNILKGAKKVRLIFSVDSSSKVVNTFAIPVWNTSDCKYCGFRYCDITEDSFLKISDLVDKLKIINENNDFNYLLNDGNLLNLNIIKKPDLCKKCINDGNRTKKEACNLARFKQIDAIEFICSSFKSVKKRKFNSLRDIKIFNQLSEEELKIVDNFLFRSEFNAGDIILRENAFGTSTHFLVRGTLEVIKQKSTNEQAVIATITPGYSVGEMAMIDGYIRSATVVAKTKGSLLTLDNENLIRIQKEYPKIGINIYKGITNLLCMNLRNISNKMSEYKLPLV